MKQCLLLTCCLPSALQKRAGQPTSTRDDACNRPEAQPGLSAGNRSIIVHHKPLSCLVPAVNSKPRAVQAAPSAAAMAVARGEMRLTGSKRRRVHSPDSFIESDGEGVSDAMLRCLPARLSISWSLA